MPTPRSSQPRRPVVVVLTLLAGLMGLLMGPTVPAGASPLDIGSEIGNGPYLRLPTGVTFAIGRAGDSYILDSDGDPIPVISIEGLPAGLRLTSYGDGSAILDGTPKGPAGDSAVLVRAQSANGVSTRSLTVSVQQAPAFIDRTPLVFRTDAFSSVIIRTAGFPVPGIGLEGDLPDGLWFVDNGDGTGTVFGIPLGGSQSAPITLTAVNEVADASETTTVQVLVRPGILTRTAGAPTR